MLNKRRFRWLLINLAVLSKSTLVMIVRSLILKPKGPIKGPLYIYLVSFLDSFCQQTNFSRSLISKIFSLFYLKTFNLPAILLAVAKSITFSSSNCFSGSAKSLSPLHRIWVSALLFFKSKSISTPISTLKLYFLSCNFNTCC